MTRVGVSDGNTPQMRPKARFAPFGLALASWR
jgi:hypothetical protein